MAYGNLTPSQNLVGMTPNPDGYSEAKQQRLTDGGTQTASGVGGAVVNGAVTYDGTTPITSSTLAPTPYITLPPATTTSSATALSGVADGVKTSAIQAKLDADAKAAQDAKTSGDQSLKNVYDEITGVTSSRAELESQAGIAQKQQASTDITNRIEASQRAQLNEIRALRSRAGLSQDAVALQEQEINRKYAFEQADLALIQSAADRNLLTAQSIIDRKIELQLEPLKLKLDYQKQVQQDNRADFTAAENRKVENMIRETERELKNVEEFEKLKGSFVLKKLESGGTFSEIERISNAKNNEELYKAYGTNPVKSKLTFKTLSDGRDVMIDEQGNVVKEITGKKLSEDEKNAEIEKEKAKEQIPFLQDKLNSIQNLRKDVKSGTGAVGPNKLARWSPLSVVTGSKQNFIAGVVQLTSQETLNTLLNLKRQGGTLGALNEKEFDALSAASTKIGAWANKDKNGNITGYNTTEKAFNAELEILERYTNLAIDRALGRDMSNDDFLNSVDVGGGEISNEDFFNNY